MKPNPELKALDTARSFRDGGSTNDEAATKRMFEVRFGIDEDTMKLLSRVQVLALSKTRRSPELPEFFALLCNEYLDRHDPVRRTERRLSKAGKQSAQAKENAAQDGTSPSVPQQPPPKPPKRSRHIPKTTRDAVHHRDGEQCTFVDRKGRRCAARRYLTIDHIHPYALGGDHDTSNLRCTQSINGRTIVWEKGDPAPPASPGVIDSSGQRASAVRQHAVIAVRCCRF